MIFSRKNIKPIRQASQMTSLQDDDVMDIAKSMVPQTSAPKTIVPQSPVAQPATNTVAKPMYFSGGSTVLPTDTRTGKGIAAVEQINTSATNTKQAAIDAAKAKAQEEMRATGGANSREVTDGIDYNKDGVIGDPTTQAGRQMTNEDLINTAIRQFLEPVDNAGARSAADEAMRQATAEGRQAARGRMGMAGMGLTGAAAAAEGTEARRGERERVLTLDEFDRNARQEQAERWLAGMGQSRESEVFKRVMAQLDKENEAELPDLDANGDGDISDAEQAAYDKAVQDKKNIQNSEATSQIMGMSQEEFEAMTPDGMAAAGWSVQKDSSGNPQVRKDAGGDYYTWVGPSGETKKAYVDDAGENFAWSMGLEWD